MQYSAKHGLAIACRLSVCLSVCLPVCDVGGSGPHRLKILETNCTNNYPSILALHGRKVIHLLPGEHGEILGRLEMGWEKVACWSTKTATSLKRIKIEESYYGGPIGSHQRSFEWYHPWPPTTSSSPRLGFTTPNQNSNRYHLRNG